jgi:hypothetical protein
MIQDARSHEFKIWYEYYAIGMHPSGKSAKITVDLICTMARDVLGSPMWNLLYVTILTPTLRFLS